MSAEPRVVAIIAAFNEEDIIGPCIAHLAAQGVDSYLLDDGSTDRTVERAEALAGKGLIGLERLTSPPNPIFSLKRILERKERLTVELEADWLINHDADEFRESLWSELTLRQAFGRVASLGFNAVDFEISTILPPDASPADERGTEWWLPPDPCDRLQVRAWYAGGVPVTLVDNGGHNVTFEGRRVFPLRFPMRHCPIRSREHGQRKVLQERLPRFDPAERAIGWHVQYEPAAINLETAFSRGARRYDATDARIRAAMANRDLELACEERDALAASAATARQQLDSAQQQHGAVERQLDDERRRSADLVQRAAGTHARLETALQELAACQQDLHDARQQLDAAREEMGVLQSTSEAINRQSVETAHRYDASLRSLHREIATLHASKSWRWTAWVRRLAGMLEHR